MNQTDAAMAPQEVARSLGLPDTADILACVFRDGRKGWLGADGQAVVVGVIRPDGHIAVRRIEDLDRLVVFPSGIGSKPGLNLAVGLDLIPVRFENADGLSVLETRLRSLIGTRFHEPPSDPESLSSQEKREGATDTDESQSESASSLETEDASADQPWYATVTGPAVQAFFTGGAESMSANQGAGAGPASEQEQEAHWKGVLKEHPDQVEPYRRLFRLYYNGGDIEKAFWQAAVLSHFGVAEPIEKEVVQKYRAKKPIRPARTIDQGMWSEMLAHPSEDPWPSQFFAVLARPLALMLGRSLRSYSLKPKDRIDVAESDLLVARVFRVVQEALKLPHLDFYLAPDAGFELAVADVVEKGRWLPSCVAGGGLLSQRSETEVTFILGRDLTYMMPQYMAGLLLPSVARQTMFMLAATKLVRPGLVDSEDMDAINEQARALDRLVTDEERGKLELLVDQMVEDKVSVNLDRWNRSIQFTSHRVGLVLCQDLPTAVRLALTDPVRPATASPEDRITELVRFAVDDHHVRTRRILGLAISS